MILEPWCNKDKGSLELERMISPIKSEPQGDSVFYSFDRHDYSDLVKARAEETIE